MLNWTHFIAPTKLESSFAISTILDDFDSDGRVMSEVIDLGRNTNIYSFKHFPNYLCSYDIQLRSLNFYYLIIFYIGI